MLKLRKTQKTASENDDKKEAVSQSQQGIIAKGNALKSIGGMALLVTLVPVLLGFSYLSLIREPYLQNQQVERVASSFAVQQATNVHHLFSQMAIRVCAITLKLTL